MKEKIGGLEQEGLSGWRWESMVERENWKELQNYDPSRKELGNLVLPCMALISWSFLYIQRKSGWKRTIKNIIIFMFQCWWEQLLWKNLLSINKSISVVNNRMSRCYTRMGQIWIYWKSREPLWWVGLLSLNRS